MSSIALADLSKLQIIKQTDLKVTSKPGGRKNRLIVKSYRIPLKNSKIHLLKSQILWMRDLKQVNTIRQVLAKDESEKHELIIIEEEQSANLTEIIEPDWNIDLDLLTNIALGLQELHNQGIFHLNLKPENILLISPKLIKFTDLQTAYLSAIKRKGNISAISSPYCPPEASENPNRSSSWDIWSLGIIFLELMLHRRIQPSQKHLVSLATLIETIDHQAIKHLLKAMLCQRQKRISIGKVVQRIKGFNIKEENQQSEYAMNQLKLHLFSSQQIRFNPKTMSKHATHNMRLGKWKISISLMHGSSGQILWLTAVNELKIERVQINMLYQQLPLDFRSIFSNWQQFYEALRGIEEQNVQLSQDGYLCFKVKTKIVRKEQPLVIDPHQISQQQVKQQKPIEAFSQSQKQKERQRQGQGQGQRQRQKQRQKLRQKQKERQRPIMNGKSSSLLHIDDQQLAFESDSDVDILKAYAGFPLTSEKCTESVQILETMLKAENPQVDLVSMSYQEMGSIYEDGGDFEWAKQAYKAARQGYFLDGRYPERQMNVLINLGNVYAKLREYGKSIKCYKRSISIARKIQNETDTNEAVAMAYRNWANVALHTKRYDTAQQSFKKSIEIIKNSEEDPSKQLCTTYVNLSNLYLAKEQYAKSNSCIQEWFKLNSKKGSENIGVLNFNWGFGLIHLSQFKEAFAKFEISLAQKYKQGMRARLEKLFENVFLQNKDAIIKQFSIHKQAIARIQKLLQLPLQNKLNAVFSGMMG